MSDSAPKQWHMGVCAQSCPTIFIGAVAYGGVCVCMLVRAKSYLTLYQSSGIWVCVCMCACSVMFDSLH